MGFELLSASGECRPFCGIAWCCQ